MRYSDFYNKVISLHRTPPTLEQSRKDARLIWGGWDILRAKLPEWNKYIPTGIPLVDAMIEAHSPVITYTLPDMNAPRTYTAGKGRIELPPPAAFMGDEYSRTLLHELSHWAGNPNHGGKDISPELLRMLPDPTADDLMTMMFGGEPVAIRVLEELTAEISAFALAQKVAPSLDTIYSASYVGDWLANAEERGYKDAQALFTVAAEQAYDRAAYLLRPLNLQPQET